MTDKQIIIDGIDVSGCEYYQYNMCTATKDNYGDCLYCCKDYDMKDCYFKQLARKTQECEAVEYDYQKQLENTNKWIAECENLQQQLDQLKVSKEQAEQKLKIDNKTMLDFLEAYYVDGENEGTFDRIEEIIKQVKGQK